MNTNVSKGAKIIATIIVLILIIWVITPHKKETQALSRIGVIAPLTGIVADYGEEMKKGINQVASSSKTQFSFEDDKCDAKEAVTAFKKLVDFGQVHFIIGPGCGSPQEAIIPLIKASNTIVLVPSAASRDLYEQSGKNFFNVQYSLEDESKFVAETFNKLNLKKVAFVHYKNAFSETHAKAFKATYAGVITDILLTDGTSDVAPELAKIKSAGVDAVYSPDVSFFFASGLIKLRQLGVTVPVYGSYVTELPSVRALVPDVIYSFPGDLGGSQGAVLELSKQAAEILSGAVEKCSSDADCVRKELISSGKFDDSGVFKRNFVLKQVKGKEVIELQ